MRPVVRVLFALLFVLQLAFPVVPAFARATAVLVPLVYTPKESQPPPVVNTSRIGSAVIQIGRFTDQRAERLRKIGVNTEKKTPVPVYTDSDVAAFCRRVAVTELGRQGLRVSDSNPDYVLDGDVADFFVNESNTYRGDIAIRFTLTDRDNHVAWQGVVRGTASNWGRSLSKENYQQTLSTALRNLYYELCRTPGFLDALRGRAER